MLIGPDQECYRVGARLQRAAGSRGARPGSFAQHGRFFPAPSGNPLPLRCCGIRPGHTVGSLAGRGLPHHGQRFQVDPHQVVALEAATKCAAPVRGHQDAGGSAAERELLERLPGGGVEYDQVGSRPLGDTSKPSEPRPVARLVTVQILRGLPARCHRADAHRWAVGGRTVGPACSRRSG